jgi:glycosyltransferase involved in cell wall biosynthesis
MRIGICAYWFNRGQGVVARQIRSALDELGHQTFVLARPTRAKNIKPSFVDHTGVWDQPGVTDGSAYRIPADELVAWGRDNELDLALFDQNYEFEAITALRDAGVATAGRFVWEQFAPHDVQPAKRAFEVVYSLTTCEQERYADLGIDSPRVRWGIHPEILDYARPSTAPDGSGRETEQPAGMCFFYPAGFLSKRKPVAEVLKAFRRFDDPDARLVVKGQVERELDTLERGAKRDPRVDVILDDLPADEHMRLFAAADVCVAPSRWEGLGLHLYESMGLGLPVITNGAPPMNEVIRDGDNGLLIASRRRGRAKSGIPAYATSVRRLATALREVADPSRLGELRAGVARARERLAWEHTVDDYAELVGRFG